jgi:hypothetical protein
MDLDWRKRASMLVRCVACVWVSVYVVGVQVNRGEDECEREKNGSKMCQTCTT